MSSTDEEHLTPRTENDRLREALARSEECLRAILDASTDTILLFDPDGHVLAGNEVAATRLGVPIAAIIGRTMADLLPPETFESYRARLLEVVRSRCPQRFLFDRAGRLLDNSIVPVVTAAGETTALAVFIRDISREQEALQEKELLERRVRQSQKMEAIGTLAGGIAHDFNNMLCAILGYTELALDDLAHDDPARANLQEVMIASRRAKTLVEQIQIFGQRSEAERKVVHVQPIVRESLRLLRASLPATIELRQHIDPAASAVVADPTQIHQVIVNLCTNAYHAMRETGGVIELRIEDVTVDHPEQLGPGRPPPRPGRYVRLAVIDDGPGMAPEMLERIFEPFFTTKRVGEGSGMGLAVVHGIVGDHGGGIAVESAVGSGAAFHVYLPATEAEPASIEGEDVRAPRGTEHVLVVDDEEQLLNLLAQTLERQGYRVTGARSGREALEAFRAAGDVDLVLTDQTMPAMTGADLARQLLAMRPRLPIILTTGYRELLSPEEARRIGIVEYLMKPLDRLQLVVAIRRALDAVAGSARRSGDERP